MQDPVPGIRYAAEDKPFKVHIPDRGGAADTPDGVPSAFLFKDNVPCIIQIQITGSIRAGPPDSQIFQRQFTGNHMEVSRGSASGEVQRDLLIVAEGICTVDRNIGSRRIHHKGCRIVGIILPEHDPDRAVRAGGHGVNRIRHAADGVGIKGDAVDIRGGIAVGVVIVFRRAVVCVQPRFTEGDIAVIPVHHVSRSRDRKADPFRETGVRPGDRFAADNHALLTCAVQCEDIGRDIIRGGSAVKVEPVSLVGAVIKVRAVQGNICAVHGGVGIRRQQSHRSQHQTIPVQIRAEDTGGGCAVSIGIAAPSKIEHRIFCRVAGNIGGIHHNGVEDPEGGGIAGDGTCTAVNGAVDQIHTAGRADRAGEVIDRGIDNVDQVGGADRAAAGDEGVRNGDVTIHAGGDRDRAGEFHAVDPDGSAVCNEGQIHPAGIGAPAQDQIAVDRDRSGTIIHIRCGKIIFPAGGAAQFGDHAIHRVPGSGNGAVCIFTPHESGRILGRPGGGVRITGTVHHVRQIIFRHGAGHSRSAVIVPCFAVIHAETVDLVCVHIVAAEPVIIQVHGIVQGGIGDRFQRDLEVGIRHIFAIGVLNGRKIKEIRTGHAGHIVGLAVNSDHIEGSNFCGGRGIAAHYAINIAEGIDLTAVRDIP